MKKCFKQFICLCLSVSMCTPVYAKNHSKNHQARYNISNTEIKKVEKNLKKEHKHNKSFNSDEFKDGLESTNLNEISYFEESNTVNDTLNEYFNSVEEYNDSSETFQNDDGEIYIFESFLDEEGNKNVRIYSENYDDIYLLTFNGEEDINVVNSIYDYNLDEYSTEITYIHPIKEVSDNEVEMQGYGAKTASAWIWGTAYWYQMDKSKVKIGCKATYVINNVNVCSSNFDKFSTNVINSSKDLNRGLAGLGVTACAVIVDLIILCVDLLVTHGIQAAAVKVCEKILGAAMPAATAGVYYWSQAKSEYQAAGKYYELIKGYGIKQ